MSFLERKIKEFHTHEQTTASAEWTIQHDLNRLPVVNVYSIVNGNEIVVNPLDVEVVDMNTCKLKFVNPISGIAEVF